MCACVCVCVRVCAVYSHFISNGHVCACLLTLKILMVLETQERNVCKWNQTRHKQHISTAISTTMAELLGKV